MGNLTAARNGGKKIAGKTTIANREASRTALATAYMRAVHQLLDPWPRLFEDPVVLSLLGPDALQRIISSVARYQTPAARALRAHVVLRSRFAEDRLLESVPRGIKQYIILGAGFDTFAFRQPAWAKGLKIREIDHPGTQALKRVRLASAGLELPVNTGIAAVDFEQETLIEGLIRCGVSPDEPTFFSWLGVTMYLKEAAIDAVLRSVTAFPAGSEIVLTFTQPRESTASSEHAPSLSLAARVARVGEPFLSCFEPEAMEARLRSAGFSIVEFLSPVEAEAKYFRQCSGNLPIPRQTAIVSAMLLDAA